MTTRSDIVNAARSYMGVPWTHIGRSRKGIDCVGLLVKVCEDLGIPYQDIRTYTRGPQVEVFLNAIRSQTGAASIGYIRPGQIAIFKQHIYPMHVGIIGLQFGRPTVIHAAARNRRVIEESLSGELQRELIEVREFPGVEN